MLVVMMMMMDDGDDNFGAGVMCASAGAINQSDVCLYIMVGDSGDDSGDVMISDDGDGNDVDDKDDK